MFAPAHGVPEDHVCGSAHCMLTPYWASKLAKNEVELFAKQVSVRGGDIRVIWHESKGTITLSGQTKVIMNFLHLNSVHNHEVVSARPKKALRPDKTVTVPSNQTLAICLNFPGRA